MEDEWKPISTYPTDCVPFDVIVKMRDGTIHERAHFAEDLSGEEQPPFKG